MVDVSQRRARFGFKPLGSVLEEEKSAGDFDRNPIARGEYACMLIPSERRVGKSSVSFSRAAGE